MTKYIKIKCEDCDGEGTYNGFPCTTCGGRGMQSIPDVDDDEEEVEIEKYWINKLYKSALRVTANNINGVTFFMYTHKYKLGHLVGGDWCFNIAMGQSTGYREVDEDTFSEFIKTDIEEGFFNV